MIVTILYRLEGSPEVAVSTFIDVANTKYYAKAVAWGEANGIVKGYGESLVSGIGNNLLAPRGNATRAQVAMILMRYCEKYMK